MDRIRSVLVSSSRTFVIVEFILREKDVSKWITLMYCAVCLYNYVIVLPKHYIISRCSLTLANASRMFCFHMLS